MVTRAAVCLSLRRTLSELWAVERVLAMEAVVTMEAAALREQQQQNIVTLQGIVI